MFILSNATNASDKTRGGDNQPGKEKNCKESRQEKGRQEKEKIKFFDFFLLRQMIAC